MKVLKIIQSVGAFVNTKKLTCFSTFWERIFYISKKCSYEIPGLISMIKL